MKNHNPSRLGRGAVQVSPVRAKAVKNFVYVNMSADGQRRMRALAECYGLPLRSIMRRIVHEQIKVLERLTGVSQWQAEQMTREQRKAKGAVLRDVFRCVGCPVFAVPLN
jgi:hypothetical protein